MLKNFGAFMLRCEDVCWLEPVCLDEEKKKRIEHILKNGYTTFIEVTCGPAGVNVFVVPSKNTGVKVSDFLEIQENNIIMKYSFPCTPTRVFFGDAELFFEVCGMFLIVDCKNNEVSYAEKVKPKLCLPGERFHVHSPKRFLRVRKI